MHKDEFVEDLGVAKRTTSKKAGNGNVTPKAVSSAPKVSRAKTKTAKAPKTKTNRAPAAGTRARTNKTASIAKRQLPLVRKSPGNDGNLPKIGSRRIKVVKERKTRLSEASLEEFRQMLLAKRRELIGDVNNLEDEAIRSGSHGGGGLSAMPIHMADIGSDTWEQELTLGLIENERGLLREIDQALERIENKTFGICLATGKVITKDRLRAQPWAKYCIEYARKRELGLV